VPPVNVGVCRRRKTRCSWNGGADDRRRSARREPTDNFFAGCRRTAAELQQLGTATGGREIARCGKRAQALSTAGVGIVPARLALSTSP
jgi:hypothetical protein